MKTTFSRQFALIAALLLIPAVVHADVGNSFSGGSGYSGGGYSGGGYSGGSGLGGMFFFMNVSMN